ncbi:MAG TPA: tetratricopeptide repeat protein [Myxococcales bacterium]|jgi:tetratricopeptide (TPR) repeat protein
MRRVVFFACLLAACADYRQKPTFPEGAAHRPVINEQAILGLSPAGDALAAQLIDADGAPPQLWLAIFDARGGPTRKVLDAPEAVARSVSAQLQQQGETPVPLLERLVRAGWPEASMKARDLGFAEQAPIAPAQFGDFDGPLSLRVDEERGPPRMLALILKEQHGYTLGSDNSARSRRRFFEVEAARMPLAGEPIAPQLYRGGPIAWMLSGSYRKGAPLHRAVGLRRADLLRGEAQLDNLRGLDAMRAGDLEEARELFSEGIAADPTYVDVLYNAASAAALMNDDAAAVALLVRAAASDPERVQVLGRSDPALRELRKRKDVRELLGERRPAPENVPPPP